MNGKSEHQSDAFKQSVCLNHLQEDKNKHNPLRIAFLENNSTDEELKEVIKKLKDSEYVIFLMNPKEGKPEDTIEGFLETISSTASLRQVNGEYLSIREFSLLMKQKATEWRAAIMQMVARLQKESYVSGLEDFEQDEEGGRSSASPDFRFTLHFNKSTMGDDENYARAQRECVEQIQEFRKKCAAAWALKLRKIQDKHEESSILPNNISSEMSDLFTHEEVLQLTKSGDEFLKTVLDLRIGHDSNLAKNELNVLLSPNRGIKDSFISFLVHEICSRLGISPRELDHVFLCGDSLADLEAGVRGINAVVDAAARSEVANATFVVPKKSRLITVMQRLQDGVEGVQEDNLPAGLKLSTFSIISSDGTGRYRYQPMQHIPELATLRQSMKQHTPETQSEFSSGQKKKDIHHQHSEIILADEAYPEAQTPTESVLIYLNEKYPAKQNN